MITKEPLMPESDNARPPAETASARRSLWFVLPSICVFAALLSYGLLGRFVRYTADDFAFAATTRQLGVLRAALHAYMTWYGRWPAELVVRSSVRFGPGLVTILPMLGLVAWSAVLIWSLRQVFLAAWPWIPRAATVLLAGLLLFVGLTSTTEVARVQTLFWNTGILAYSLPLCLLVFLVGWLARGLRLGAPLRRRSLLLDAGLALVIVCFNEMLLALQAGAALLALVACLVGKPGPRRKILARRLGAVLLGCLIGGASTVLSPGVWARKHAVDVVVPSVGSLIALSCHFALQLIRFVLVSSPSALVALFVFPALVAFAFYPGSPKGEARSALPFAVAVKWFFLCGVVALFLVWIPFVPFAFAVPDGLPPHRTFIFSEAALLCLVVAWGGLVGAGARSVLKGPAGSAAYLAGALLFTLLVARTTAYTVWRNRSLTPKLSQWAQAWDARDRNLWAAAAAGTGEMELPPIGNWLFLEDVAPDPGFWVNKDYCRYYGLRSVVAHKAPNHVHQDGRCYKWGCTELP